MNEQDADRLRDAITRHQTTCRCGVLLASCADCRGWLVEHSPRIERAWRWFVDRYCWASDYDFREDVGDANEREADDLAEYLRARP